MFHYQRRSAVALLVSVALVPLEAATVSRQSADEFAQKIELIQDQADGGGPAERQRTRLTEDEFNSWLLYRGERLVPTGIGRPQVTIIGDGRVTGQAVVDLDAVAKRRSPRGGLDPLSLIGGTVPVSVTGLLHTRDGMARFEVESAEMSGIPVPVTVLQELVTYYSRTPERPQGLRLDDTFALPAGIRQIEVGRAQAVVVQ